MNKYGPIVIIEDDKDDQDLMALVFRELECVNEVIFFNDGVAALEYLKQEEVYPFLVLSDINMPKLNGFELRKMVHTNEGLSKKCVPYLFFTTATGSDEVYRAYALSVQGFFVKPTTYHRLLSTIRTILEYWRECYSPNRVTN